MGGESDLELAQALAAGRVEALERLSDRYGRLAYSVAFRILGDPGRAEDAVQDAFLKLWHSASQFDPHRGSFRTWVITSVRNRSIDYLRGRAAHGRQEPEMLVETEARGPGSHPSQEVATPIQRDLIQEALASLPVEQRQAVELAYFGGYSGAEIAEMVRVPSSTVKGRMRVALEKLHSYLQGRGFIHEG